MTDRELLILDYLSKVRIATTKQIQDVFFTGLHHSVSYRVLKGLIDAKLIKRKYYRHKDKNTHVYFLDQPPSKRNIDHDILITEFCVELIRNNYDIVSYEKSPAVASIIPDSELWFKKNNVLYSCFLEVQLSNHDCIKKYFNLSNKVDRKLPSTLYIISDKKINMQKLRDFKVVIDDLTMKEINNTFKEE